MIDYHIHTDHSGDGRTPIEAMVEAAIAKGLEEICITSHHDADSLSVSGHDFDLDFPRYVGDVLGCAARYGDRIAVKLGAEIGMHAPKPHVQALADKRIGEHAFDFIIASIHHLPGPNFHRPAIWVENGVDKFAMQTRYLEHLLDATAQFDAFSVIGHLTYYSRFSPDDGNPREMVYDDHPALYDDLFKALIRRGKGIEVNTSTLDTFGFCMPDFSILRRFRALGGEIVTIGSDAHIPAHVGRHYGHAVAMLREAGFEAICAFDKMTPCFIPI
jgi:histidinol-phosphatase (PHP family)